jgi:hypothetical protein
MIAIFGASGSFVQTHVTSWNQRCGDANQQNSPWDVSNNYGDTTGKVADSMGAVNGPFFVAVIHTLRGFHHQTWESNQPKLQTPSGNLT